MSHNGYTNFETWTVMNAIGNDTELYKFFKTLVKECKRNTKKKIEFKSQVMWLTRNTIESMKPKTDNIIWEPMLNAILCDHINYAEIADHLMEDFS